MRLLVLSAVLACAAAPAHAVRSRAPNGAHVNPDNGSTTAGKTGLMRCRDGGRIARERELAADGSAMRDDEVFEDGSRKAAGR